MKIRQAQTSATYILPDPGELDKRVQIRQRVDTPSDDMGTEPTYPVQFYAWAKVRQVGATTWHESAQTDQAITHYFTIRYREEITSDFEIVFNKNIYAIKRSRDLNDKKRFLLLECEELGAVEKVGGMYG